MANIANRRASHQRTVSRIYHFTLLAEFENTNAHLLEEKAHQLKVAFDRFKEEHLKVIETVEGDDVEAEHTLLEALENEYTMAQVAISMRLESLQEAQDQRDYERNRQRAESRQNSFNSTTNEAANEENNGQRAAGNGNNANANNDRAENDCAEADLEKIKLQKFNGEYGKWPEWRSSYDSLVHNSRTMSNTNKFHRLKSRLTGKAERVLAGWNVTGENYLAAYDTLVKIYENKYRMTLALLDDLFNIPPQPEENDESLRIILDTMNRCIRQLKACGSPVATWDHMLIYYLFVKMPPTTRKMFDTSKKLTEMPTLQEVMNFLEDRANGYVDMIRLGSQQLQNQPSTSNGNSSNDHSLVKYTGAIPRQNTNQRHNSNPYPTKGNIPKGGLSCHNCGLPHPISSCAAFRAMTVRERENRVRELKLCINCFSPNHAARSLSCRAGPCMRCKKGLFHNTLLCRMPTTTAMMAITNQPQGNFQLAPVQNTQTLPSGQAENNTSKFQDFH